MKTKDQLVIKITAFLGIFCFLFSYFSTIFNPYSHRDVPMIARFDSFYDQPENSIDVLYLGASSLYMGIIPLDIWEKHGFTGFVRATAIQAPVVSYYYLVETLKYQSPNVVVIETNSIFNKYQVDEEESSLRRSIDPMRFSNEKLQLIVEVTSKSERQTIASYIFPLLRYHSRWDELTRNNFEKSANEIIDPNKGYYGLYFNTSSVNFPQDFMQPADKAKNLSKDSLNYYEKMIQLCQENNIQVVLITMPRTNWDYPMHLGIQQLADKYNLQYVDYCLDENMEIIDLDTNTDFADDIHLNTLGAKKVSHHLGGFLQDMYHLADKRNDPAYQQWNIDLLAFKDIFTEGAASVAE